MSNQESCKVVSQFVDSTGHKKNIKIRWQDGCQGMILETCHSSPVTCSAIITESLDGQQVVVQGKTREASV